MASGTARAKPAPRAIDLVDIRRTPGHLLRRAQQRAVDLFVQAVGENGLRPPQFAVLVTVYQNPGLNQTHLVDKTGIDRSTVADMIDRMVARGYIERKRDAADQRVNTLWATGAGIAALDACVDAAMAVQDEILAPVPPEKRAAVLEALVLLAELPPDEA
ncbi:MAG TPA: MarR family winged helix-turn-helix transcriptional regulator [Alphaproteobacteria bacterium]|jgi:DNA-binding MarR family transcriptional regulator